MNYLIEPPSQEFLEFHEKVVNAHLREKEILQLEEKLLELFKIRKDEFSTEMANEDFLLFQNFIAQRRYLNQ